MDASTNEFTDSYNVPEIIEATPAAGEQTLQESPEALLDTPASDDTLFSDSTTEGVSRTDGTNEVSSQEQVPLQENPTADDTVYTVDDIYTLLESMLSDSGHSTEDIYTFLESCFPVSEEEPKDIYTLLETIADNQVKSIETLKAQNSILICIFTLSCVIGGLLLARIVWRKI